jgi:hypothetical protein
MAGNSDIAVVHFLFDWCHSVILAKKLESLNLALPLIASRITQSDIGRLFDSEAIASGCWTRRSGDTPS